MKFENKAGVVFTVPLVIGVGLTYFGFQVLIAFYFGFVIFLWINGLHYLKLAYRTIPRDMRLFYKLITAARRMKEITTAHPYISDVFQQNVCKYPKKVALIYEGRKVTFSELDELSNKLANVLRTSTNLQQGDCVAVFMENCLEYVAIFLALSKIGVIGALINCNLRGKGLIHCVEVANCRGIVYGCGLSEALSDILPDLDPSVSQVLFSVGGDSSITGAKNLESEAEGASSSTPSPPLKKSTTDILCYIYTSGTTGFPKACNITHHKFIGTSLVFGILSNIVPEDIVYDVLPLYHSSGLSIAAGQMLVNGTTLVLRKKFSASNFSDDCFNHKCTVFFYIGEICRYLLDQPAKPIDTKLHLRKFIGNGLRAGIWKPLQKRFCIPNIVETYGLAEGNVYTVNLVNKPGAIGYKFRFFPFLQNLTMIKINPVNGEYFRDSRGFCVQAEVNEPGECIGKISKRTPFLGYKDSSATKKKVITDVFQKGDRYFLSGDILRMDEEGFLYFCDRSGDTFRWKGENVSTTEVENVMARILQLKRVVVYGVEVARSEGRAGMAAIEGTADSVDLSDLAKQLLEALPKYAVPIFIRFVPAAELTGTFKLKKLKLRSEGFDMSVPDPLYFLDSSSKVYIPLTKDLYEEINSGTFRL